MIALKQDLENRGFLHQYTHEELFEKFEKWGEKFYFWVDCSANSMTIWNFVALMMAVHFMLRWNKCYLLVGGATSTIWNPSGKDTERPILTPEDLAENQKWIRAQFERLTANIAEITGKKLDYEVVNNYDFHKNMTSLDYLREIGRYVTVNWMLGKDIVKKRVTDPDKSISYAEFSYMLIMGYDYYYLWKHHGVTLEVGGSDEWDGILAGLELVQKKDNVSVYGATNKLIMDANGKKFGKSEGNAIWLDASRTSPYEMYQYFMNTLDDDIGRYLRLFSFLSMQEIQEIEAKHMSAPEKREWQKILARSVVTMAHGTKQAELAENVTEFLFGSADKLELLQQLDEDSFADFAAEIGSMKYNDQNLFGLFVDAGLEQSNGSARQSLSSWALYINEQKIEDSHYDASGDFIDEKFLLLRKGKKKYMLVLK